MEAIRINDFCDEHEYNRKQVDDLRRKMGIKAKKRNNIWTITGEEAAALDRELALPEELTSETYYARGLHEAQNPIWLFCIIEGLEGKHPVKIRKDFGRRLVGKRFPIEKIEDETGITWRHEWYRKIESYCG